MKMPLFLLSLPTLLCSLVFSAVSVQADHHAKSSAPLLQTGDRVAFVGGGLIERARLNGYLETARVHLQTLYTSASTGAC